MLRSRLNRYSEARRDFQALEVVRSDRRATIALLEKVRAYDGPADLKATIIMQLGNHAGEETIDALADVLEDEPSWRARVAATVALGNYNDPRARQLLDEAQSDSHRRVRERAGYNRTHPGAFAKYL